MLILSSSSQAKEWRGIVPLHSTCEDVKRILGINKCQTSTYYFKEENIFIHFSESTCEGKPPGNWDVPTGTVMAITVWPKVKPKLVGLHIDESKFKKERDPHLPEHIIYTDYEEGFSFEASPDGYDTPANLDQPLRW
jgi:hypothetical protein